MAHRSKRKHVKHEHEHEPQHVTPEPVSGDLPPSTIPRMLAQIAFELSRRVVRRVLARPRRMLERVRAVVPHRRHAEAT
jgi:hypothetical protein